MIDFREEFKHGVPKELPAFKELDASVDHAPKRPDVLNKEQKKLALANSLRYFPEEWHEELAVEFMQELEDYGHIYMYRFRPEYEMYARPISEYPTENIQAACIMLMLSLIHI